MPSLAELRKKVKGITSTRKITRAMKMVAGARFGRAQVGLNGARRFATDLDTMLNDILAQTGAERDIMRILIGHDLPSVKKTALIVITGDKGLCGDFNNSVMREADRMIKADPAGIGAVFAVGRKACDHYRKMRLSSLTEYSMVFTTLDFALADRIVTDVVAAVMTKGITQVSVMSANFVSMMKHAVTEKKLLPLTYEKPANARESLLEPSGQNEILSALLPMVLKARMYRMLRESYVAELAARMRAMDNATNNAGSLIERITLEMNKVRQANITREIAEIIGTNEVVK